MVPRHLVLYALLALLLTPALALAQASGTVNLRGGNLTGIQDMNVAEFGGAGVALGQQLKVNSLPVTISSDHFGQATMAKSLPVVISSDQSPFPVTASGLPWTFRLQDGNSATLVDVKPAFQPPTAADAALVVAPTPTSIHLANVGQIAGSATVTAGVAGLQAIGGNAASAATDSGNPVKVGGVVGISLPAAGADTQRMNLMTDKFGRAVIVENGDRGLKQVCSSVTVSTTTETTLCSAVGAGVFLDLEHLSCSNTSATLVRVDVRDATAGTVRKSMALAASGGGFEMNLGSTWPQTTANNNWTIQLSGAVTDVRCQAVAMKNK